MVSRSKHCPLADYANKVRPTLIQATAASFLALPCSLFIISSHSILGELITWWVRFQVLTVASVKVAIFWIVAPFSLVEVYLLFKGACCLHHQGDKHLSNARLHGATTQKTAIFITTGCCWEASLIITLPPPTQLHHVPQVRWSQLLGDRVTQTGRRLHIKRWSVQEATERTLISSPPDWNCFSYARLCVSVFPLGMYECMFVSMYVLIHKFGNKII
jgi:hypothetical protein